MSAKTMAEVLTDHQRHNASSCLCGWAKLGHSHPEHQADMLDTAGYRKQATAIAEELCNDKCPCGHTWDEHNFDAGCIAGWEYQGADPGVASKDGCYCQLAHTEKSN